MLSFCRGCQWASRATRRQRIGSAEVLTFRIRQGRFLLFDGAVATRPMAECVSPVTHKQGRVCSKTTWPASQPGTYLYKLQVSLKDRHFERVRSANWLYDLCDLWHPTPHPTGPLSIAAMKSVHSVLLSGFVHRVLGTACWVLTPTTIAESQQPFPSGKPIRPC